MTNEVPEGSKNETASTDAVGSLPATDNTVVPNDSYVGSNLTNDSISNPSQDTNKLVFPYDEPAGEVKEPQKTKKWVRILQLATVALFVYPLFFSLYVFFSGITSDEEYAFIGTVFSVAIFVGILIAILPVVLSLTIRRAPDPIKITLSITSIVLAIYLLGPVLIPQLVW